MRHCPWTHGVQSVVKARCAYQDPWIHGRGSNKQKYKAGVLGSKEKGAISGNHKEKLCLIMQNLRSQGTKMLELFQEQFHYPAMRKTQPSREPASEHSDHKNVNSHCQVTKQNRGLDLGTPGVQIEVQIGENGSRESTQWSIQPSVSTWGIINLDSSGNTHCQLLEQTGRWAWADPESTNQSEAHLGILGPF